ncbi:MAG: aldehyde dehydrogenase family protein [Polyangiaceae bacterium]
MSSSPTPFAADREARPTSPTLLPCRNPATGEVFGEVPIHDAADVKRIVSRAREAQRAWGATTMKERKRVLARLLEVIVDRQTEIAELAARDSGKTMVDAAMGEVFPVCEKIRYVLANGERDLAPEVRSSGFLLHKRAELVFEPLGVVGVISPWNFPFHNLLCPLVPALFAGNAVVTKVSELATWSSLRYLSMIRDVLRELGHDPALVDVVVGYGATGQALVESGADKIFFTGSPENGRRVAETAAKHLVPVVLELGGKDPMIVCDDADLDRALDSASLGVFTACGQMCVGVERIYVMEGVYDAFVEGAKRRVDRLRQGIPLGGPIVDLGATTMPRQLDIIQALVDDAISKGARALAGGSRRTDLPGTYFSPTLLVDVDHTMRITQEEVFGPVMVVMKVRDEEDAIARANDCPYGLGSSVFTRDLARGARIARRIRAGMSVVNDYGLAYMMQSLPFGGVKISGYGKINGREGLRACCHEKAIVNDRLPFGKAVAIHPIRPETHGIVEGAISLIYARGAGKKARAAGSLVRLLVGAALHRSASDPRT